MVEAPADSAQIEQFRGLFIVCQNLQQSVCFYEGLGFVEKRASQRSRVLEFGAIELHLHENLTKIEQDTYQVSYQRGGSGLVLLFTCSDVQALWQKASESARLVAPRVAPWGDRIAIFQDPDGYRLEFRQEGS